MSVFKLGGYISSFVGRNKMLQWAASSISMSCSRVLGYFARSAGSLNCVGLTKMLQTEMSVSWFAFSIRDMCPL